MSNILARINGKPLKDYQHKDHGSLTSLPNFSTVGSLMGNLTHDSVMTEGRTVYFVYASLYRMHRITLYDYFKTGLMILAGSISHVIRPRLKLYQSACTGGCGISALSVLDEWYERQA